jgi:Tol biopolymer transport system component
MALRHAGRARGYVHERPARQRGAPVTRPRQRARRWRVVLATALLVGILLSMPASSSEAHTCTPDASVGVSGRLVVPRASGVGIIELPGRATQSVAITPSQGVAASVAVSPDGAVLAVPRFWRPPADRVGGQDILLVPTSGGDPLSTITRGQPGEIVGAPAWLSDGSLVYERRQLNDPPESVRIERVRPNGQNEPAQLVMLGGSWPSASPDGTHLVMVRSSTSERLILTAADGSNEHVLVDRTEFQTLAFPRFSPDGTWIAFTAATDPSSVPEVGPARVGQRAAVDVPLPQLILRLPFFGASLSASSVRAHGVPWDVWLVRPDGSGLQRLTIFQDDDSSLAWSPDGRYIATLSAEAIHVVSLDGTESYCISAEGGYGGMEWLP